MDDPELDALPRAYRVGLRLRAPGADHNLIADCLDIDPEGVGALLDIGFAKLEHLQQAARGVDPSGPQREA